MRMRCRCGRPAGSSAGPKYSLREVTQPPRGGYDWRVCILADWDELRRRVEDAVESEDLRTLISETAARVETLIDEISVWTCAPENAEWVRRCQRRPRAEWVV